VFIGREKELTSMREALQGDGSRRKVVLLQGLGGIGKTQLAVSFLKEHADSYSATVWLDAKTEDALRQSFAATAKRLYKYHSGSEPLRKAVESNEIDDTVANIKEWFSTKGNHQWLLVFDNVDNPKLPGLEDPEAYNIESYFPETTKDLLSSLPDPLALQLARSCLFQSLIPEKALRY
jgi:AAA+ ATPase superfamily predicted ATPase